MLCIDCKQAEAVPRGQRCRPCGRVREQVMVAASNKRAREVRKAKMKETPHLCQQYGCGNPKEEGFLKCSSCREKSNIRQRKHAEKVRSADKPVKTEDEQIEQIPPWTPRPKPPPILTDEEQGRINVETLIRMAARCGYGQGPIYRYTPHEILNYTGGHNGPRS
jgi:DNA-directed RNA polymerase subunit M/transcription elongation factor TFIIS